MKLYLCSCIFNMDLSCIHSSKFLMDFIGLQNLNVRPSLDTNAAEKRDIISHFLFDIIPNV